MSLYIEDLNFSYDKKNLFFENLSTIITPSKITALIGANGCGKTTLLKNIANQFKAISAKIFYDDMDLLNISDNKRARTLSYMSQHQNSVEKITALDTILLGRKPYIKYRYIKKDYDLANEFITLLNLKNVLEKEFSSLSGGEKQRVMLAKSLMQEPKILLLDEPNNHLDPKNQIEAMQLVEYISKKFNLITIIVLHDINLTLRFADEVVMMKDTKIMNHIKIKDIKKEHLEEIYDMPIEFINSKSYKSVVFNPQNTKLIKV